MTANPATAAIGGGRAAEGTGISIGLSAGQIFRLDGSVRETKRAYTDIPGDQLYYGHYLEHYDLQELGFDSSYPAVGLGMDFRGRWLTLELDSFYMRADAAPTAEREPFALRVDEIEYQGRTYEYMLIEQGDSFEAEAQAFSLSGRLLLTPFHLAGRERRWTLSPWLSAGIFSFAGRYRIDAGEPRGVTTYEYHPHPYVIGGRGKGWAGVAVPELGGGAELAVTLGSRHDQPVRLILSGNFAVFRWDGLTSELGASARNEKYLDVDYTAWDGSGVLEVPLKSGRRILAAVKYRHIEAEVDIEALHRHPQEQEALREKYDKHAEISLDTLFLSIGIGF